MRKKLILLSSLLVFVTQAQVYLKISNDSIFPFIYAGGDEFNNETLNEQDWKNGIGGRRVLMTQDLSFSPKNVTLKNGLINFIAMKEDSNYVLYDWEIDSSFLKKEKLQLEKNIFKTKYSAGGIVSKNKFHYGLYEISFKVEEGKGVWPAFWFYGGNKNEEIDIFELKCEKNDEIHVDTHCPYGCDRGYKNKLGIKTNWGGWMPVSNYLHEGYNSMTFEWKKHELFWYVNGLPLAYFKGEFPNPMNLYLNTSVAKDGGAFKPGPDETTIWPNNYSVDYYRIWQPVMPDSTVTLKVNDNMVSSTQLTSIKIAEPKKKNGLNYKKNKLKAIEGFVFLSLTSNNQLTLRVHGKIKQKGTVLVIKGNEMERNFSDFESNVSFQLPKEEKQITLIITGNDMHYEQKIEIRH